MEISRKDFFLKLLALGQGGLWSSAYAAESSAQRPKPLAPSRKRAKRVASDDLFLVIFLRGGADALGLVPPIGGPDRAIYESARPTLKIAASGDLGLLKLDDRFGLHPGAKPLHSLYTEGKLAVVHAAGLTADTRSHFDAQAYMETGTPETKNTGSGWLTRHLKSRGLGHTSFEAVSVNALVPTSLLSFEQAVALNAIDGFNLGGNGGLRGDELATLAAFYPETAREWLLDAGAETLGVIRRMDTTPTVTARGDYPKGDIGNRMKIAAQLTKMNLGVKVLTCDMGGWDTHKYQGKGAEGHFGDQVRQLSQAVAAFYGEMRKDGRAVTILIQSEFGRRVKENANQGTDHGHGGVMLVLGDHVRGGKVYGDWRGLSTEHLYERADLAVTTDYRQVVAELLEERFGENDLASVFPGYRGYRPLGLIAI